MVHSYVVASNNETLTSPPSLHKLEHASQLRDALKSLLADKGETDPANLLSETVKTAFDLPKYVRINLVKWGAEEGLSYLRNTFPEAVVDTLLPCVVALPATLKSLSTNPMVEQV
jgi:hypothetical protein